MDSKVRKLNEARYFLECMQMNSGSQHEFDCTLSAFLSAARSVLQYIYVDVEGKKSAQAWYDNMMSNNQDMGLFRELRDDNIHEDPIRTTKHADSSGKRIHYFNTIHTQAEVLSLANRYIYAIAEFLNEGIEKGYIQTEDEV